MKINFKKAKFIPSIFLVGIYIFMLMIFPYKVVIYFDINNINLKNIVLLISNIVSAVVIIIFINKFKLNSLVTYRKKLRINELLINVVSGYFIIMITQFLVIIFFRYMGIDFISENSISVANYMKKYPVFMLYVLLIAPILEELIFRRVIFGYLYDVIETNKEKYKFLISAVLSGFLFALPHDGIKPIMIVYILISTILSYFYKSTKNICVPILIHILINLTTIIY